MSKSPRGISQQQLDFILLLRSDHGRVAWKAYMGAYHRCQSVKTAEANSSRLLKNAKVAAYLSDLDQEALKEINLTGDRVTKEKARVAFFDPRKLFHPTGELKKIHELDDDTASCLTSFEVLIKTTKDDGGEAPVCLVAKVSWEKKTSILDQLYKQLGQYDKDNKQQSGGMDELLRAVDGKTRGLPPNGEDD